jgi:hypothetical protein
LPFLSHPQYSYFGKVIWPLEEKGGKNGEVEIAGRGRDMDERGHRMKAGDVVSDNQKEKICFLKRETKS